MTCQKHRPRRWLLYVSVTAFVLIGIAILSPSSPSVNETQSEMSDSQRIFLSRLDVFQERASMAPNSLALKNILNTRDTQLASLTSVENWSGVVLGIQSMQEKGAISIDIGGATVLAGIHLTYGLDTLIPSSQTSIYNELLTLQRGDRLQFSGSFVSHKGSVVEMSYTGSNAVSAPEFLFDFSALSPQR